VILLIRKLEPYLLIFPTYFLFIVFFVIPFFQSFLLSFYDWNGFSVEKKFVGLMNYLHLFQDPDFWNAMKNTVIYTAGTVVPSLAIGLLIALLLSKPLRGLPVFRAVYFLPTVISMVAVSVVWNWIYSPEMYGLANSFLTAMGLKKQSWLSDPHLALLSLMVMGVWKHIGYTMIIFLAGIKSIPNELYESAAIDGAGSWKQFLHITFPLLKPTTTFLVIISTIESFKVFDQINIMTKGGPAGATEVIVSYLYKLGFGEFEMGYASAIAFILFILIGGATMIQRKLLEGKSD
jgi:ABC-type sugar transport system permease subunit